MERKWLKEALFCGMTATAFRLGTTLSLGWFWMRNNGCVILYRGSGITEINLDDVIAADAINSEEITVPDYLEHDNNQVYFYLIRRANCCGELEHTIKAAVKVAVGRDGQLLADEPNDIFDAKIKQTGGNKVEIIWLYVPLDQKALPKQFWIYTDNSAGQIDYGSPLATVEYRGAGFYRYESEILTAGRRLFAIRAEDQSGISDNSRDTLKFEIDTGSCEAIEVSGCTVI